MVRTQRQISLIKNLTGQRFGRLLVFGIHFLKPLPCRVSWDCLCDCGNVRLDVDGSHLRRGNYRSCCCLQREVSQRPRKHGDCYTVEYWAYQGAKSRCHNPNESYYKHYGGRGIEFRFESYEQFFAEIGRKPSPTHSLDRIDVNGHYEIGNVRWATPGEQARNKRRQRFLTFNGDTRCIPEWAQILSITAQRIYHRLRRGWCDVCSLTQPHRGNCRHQ